MGHWGRRSEGSFPSLLLFSIQLWEEGVLRRFFFCWTHIYIQLWGGFLWFFPWFSQLFVPNEPKSAVRPLGPSCSPQSREGEQPWDHLPIVAVARSRCPGQEYKNWETIPLDILSQLPIICCLRVFWEVAAPSRPLTALSGPCCRACLIIPLHNRNDLNEQKFLPFSCWLCHLQSILMGFILVWQNWGNVAARPPDPHCSK